MKKEKKLKAPVRKGYVKVPVVMQMENLECGAASLSMIAAYYGLWLPLEQVRRDCGVSRDGSNAKNLMQAGRKYGFNVAGYRCELDLLREEGSFPCIVHWEFNHFVVLKGFKKGKAYINDPARGERILTMEEFDRGFTGICLEFEPTEEFVPSGKRKSMLSFAKKRLKGTTSAFVLVLATTIIATLVQVINPVFSRVLVDRLLTRDNIEWLYPFVAFLFIFTIIQLIVAWIRCTYLLRIQGKFAIIANSRFIWHVLKIPAEFFSQRLAGDISARQKENESISNALFQSFAPLVLDALMMIFYFYIMMHYSPILTAIGVLGILINLVLSQYISKKRVNITRVQMRDAGKLASKTLSGMEMIETIKASGAEDGFFEKWAGYQATVNSGKVAFQKLDSYIGMLPGVISSLSNIIILGVGVYLTMQEKFTVGMILAFQGFVSSFQKPATEVISASKTLQEMRTSMERVEDVLNYPTDEFYNHESDALSLNSCEMIEKLSGNIELRNVTFGYSKLAPPLIENFNMKLEPGKTVALVGFSGCGKSTISKLISGLYQPWSGEILYDGKKFLQINHDIFTASVAVVDQEIILFEDTIENNIKMWDDSIDESEMIQAAKEAQIHDAIIVREDGYKYRMREGGRDFSGGQRQRLEIARALSQNPSVLILDEATSSLDAKTEYDVVNAIKNRGITMIIIAHRLSTIRDCDEIIVLSRGKVIERGTHEQLIVKNGEYKKLISSE